VLSRKIVSSHDVVVTNINIVEGSIYRIDRSEQTEERVEIVSRTIIRGTLKAPNSQLVTPISIKLQRPDGCD
jgi:hypothetical protein